jgi:sugar (pentulose or hexulose) kinase
MTVLAGPVDRAAVAREGMSLVRTVTGRHEALIAGSPAAGAMLRWWLDTVLPDRTVADAVPGPAAVPPAPTGMVVLPYPHGRQAPAPDPAARVRVLDAGDRDVTAQALVPVPGTELPGTDLPPEATRLTVAVLEGLALQARWMLRAQAALAAGGGAVGRDAAGADDAWAAPAPPLLVLGGAGASGSAWMHLKAAVTGADVHVVATAEPVATGAALLAAERVGLVPPGRMRLPVRVLAAPADAGRYDAVLERFVAAATGSAPGPAPAAAAARAAAPAARPTPDSEETP